MRIVAWNINSRARAKAFRDGFVEALSALEADLVVLTEYVTHDSHEMALDKLAGAGLRHRLSTEPTTGENQVLILSRWELIRGKITGPPIYPSVPSNVLHVHVPEAGLEVLGLRMTDLREWPKLRRAWWDWLESVAEQCVNRPFLIAGDMNTDATYSRARCGDRPARLVAGGWQHAAPSEGASYYTTTNLPKRIDHAFVTKLFCVREARYATESGGHRLMGKPAEALSDHAALVVDLERTL